MKKLPLGPPPNRQTVEICIHLFTMLRDEAKKLSPADVKRFEQDLINQVTGHELAKLLVAYLKRP